jgi:hypothetical protein
MALLAGKETTPGTRCALHAVPGSAAVVWMAITGEETDALQATLDECDAQIGIATDIDLSGITEVGLRRWWNFVSGGSGMVRVLVRGEVNHAGGDRLAEALPAVTLAHGDLAWAAQRPEQHRRDVGRRERGLRPDPPLERLMQPLARIRRPRRLPLARRQAYGGGQRRVSLFQAGVHRVTPWTPPAQQRPPPRLELRRHEAHRRAACRCSDRLRAFTDGRTDSARIS